MTVEGKRLFAAAGDRLLLELREVQMEGRKRLPGDVFANGARLTNHEFLGEVKN